VVSPTGPDAGDVYVSNAANGSSNVSVIDPSTDKVVATVPVGANPNGVAVSPNGPDAGDIYVTNNGSENVSVIDPSTDKVVATIPVGGRPSIGVAVSPTGPAAGDIYVPLLADSGTVSVIEP
jgi:YVTN family beta-propeller protein